MARTSLRSEVGSINPGSPNAQRLAEQKALAYADQVAQLAKRPGGYRLPDPGFNGQGTGQNPFGTHSATGANGVMTSEYNLPYPNAPKDGGPQDQANQRFMQGSDSTYNTQQYILNNKPGWDQYLALALAAASTGAAGYAVAPSLAAGIGGTAASGGVEGTALAAEAAGTGATAAAGALTGAGAGAFTAGLQGQNIGKGALLGGIGGGIGAFAGPAANSLSSSTGIPSYLSSGLIKGAIGAGTNAAGAGLSGGNIGNAALTGGVGGFLSGAIGNATGSNTLGKVAGGVGTQFLGGSTNTPHPTATIGTPHSGGGSNYLGAAAGAVGAGALYGGVGGSLGGVGGIGGQGNIGNMAGTSTDTTLAGTITGALPGIIQAGAGVYGSQNAAEKMTQADQNAIGTQQSTLGNIGNIWQTQRNLGTGADTALGSALGTNGKPADYSGFENMPGYKFAVQQGTQAIQRQAASLGNAYTPNTAEAVGQYVTGTAMQDYNTYINQLMGAAGLGSTANAGLATPNYQTGANISQLQQNQGYAQASGVSGAANAVGGAFGPNGVGTGLLGAAGRYLGGGGGAGGGAPGGGGGFNPNSGKNTASGGNYGTSMNNPFLGTGNGSFGSGVDPTTGQSWVDQSSLTTPTFDPNSVSTPDFSSLDTSGDSYFTPSDFGNLGDGGF